MPVAASRAKRDYERTVLGNGPRYFWRLRLSKGNSRTWSRVTIGDYIVFRGPLQYFASSQVIAKKCDRALAQRLWGTDPSGDTWDLIFELSRPNPIIASVQDYEPIFGQRLGAFALVARERLEMAFSEFGRDRFLQTFGIDKGVRLDSAE